MEEKKRKIIIVDDDEFLLQLLVNEFTQLGFDVQTFTVGKDALTFILKEENLKGVFLMILDRLLPDMDGIDILREFVAKSKVKIPTLFLSVLHSEADILAGLQTGATDYIGKPFSLYQLVKKALNLLERQQTKA